MGTTSRHWLHQQAVDVGLQEKHHAGALPWRPMGEARKQKQ